MKTMGEIIAGRRKELGMTQTGLAVKMKVTDKAVSKWERDLACPDIHSLATLADALDISVDELLRAKSNRAPKQSAREIVGLVLKVVPLGMGIATVVLSILGELDPVTGLTLLAVGLTCLALGALDGHEE